MPTPNSLDTLIAKLKMLNQLDEGDLSAKEILSQWIASLKASKFKKTGAGGTQLSLKGPGAGLSGGSVSQDLSLLSIANEWLKNIAQNVEKIAERIGVAAPAPAAQVAETLATAKTPTRQGSYTEESPMRPSAPAAAPAASLPLSGVLKLVLLMKPLKKLAGLGVETEKGLVSLGRGLLAVGKPIAMIGGVIGNFGIKNTIVLRMLLGSLLKLSQSSQGVEEGFISFGKALQFLAKPIMMIGSVIANFGIKNALVLRVLLGSLSKMSGMGKRVMTSMMQFGTALQTLSKPIQEIGSVIANFGMKNALALFLLLKGLVNIGKNSKGVKTGLVELGEGLGEVGKSLKSIIDPITDLFNSLLKGAFAVIVFAGGLYLVAKAITAFADIEWETVGKATVVMLGLALLGMALSKMSGSMIIAAVSLVVLGAAIWVAAEALQHFGGIKWVDVMIGVVAISAIAAAASFASPILLVAGAALLVFGVGLLATATALQLLGDSTDSLEKLTKIDAENLWSVAGAITAISVALAAFGVGQAAAGIGSFFANVLTMGQDSPVEQMEKMSKMGPGLVQAADGFSRIPGAVKQFAEADMEKGLNAMGKVSNAAKLFPQPTAAGRPDMQSLTPVTSQSEKAGSAIVNAPTTNSSTNVVNNNSSMVMPAPPPRNSEPTINSSWFRSYAPA